MSATAAAQLDLTTLSSTDEDAFESEAAWLNAFLASQHQLAPGSSTVGSLSALESTLSRSLAQLDAAAHDTSAQVDRLIDEISRGIPRLAFDLQLLRENALLLRYTLDSVRKRAGSGKGFGEDEQVSDVLEKLQVLDKIKTRMEEARDVLREAESWSTLEGEVSSLLAENSHRKAAERLQEAAKSMIVFQNTAEYEARRGLMVSLQNQLETALSSSLVDAIKAHDIKACKNQYSIFEMIDHVYEFTRYYFENRRSSLAATWTSAPLSDCAEAGLQGEPGIERVKLAQFLSKFYADFYALLNEEKTCIPAIFPNPSPVLSDFVQTTLEGLSPSMSTRLTALNDHYGPVVLPELITAYKNAEQFATQVERLVTAVAIGAVANNSSSPLASPSAAAQPGSASSSVSSPSKRERRPSKRRSLSQRLSSRSIASAVGVAKPADEIVRAWETAILEPFLDYQSDYASLEQAYLANVVKQIENAENLLSYIDSSSDSSASRTKEGSRKLNERATAVMNACDDAIGRLLSFTHGYAAVGAVRTIDDTLAAFFMRRTNELGRLKSSNAHARGPSSSAAMASDELGGFDGLEYTNEDWASFQTGLRLLDTCRSLWDKLKSFERKLQSRLTTLAFAVREAKVDPSYSVPGTTRGAITLLRQSVLNSSDLETLLEPLEKNEGATRRRFLDKARESQTELTKATQTHLHRTLLAPLLAHLNEFARLNVWTQSAQDMADGKGAFDLAIPTFSLSPTDPIARVGEGLFNLPRLFAVYANDDALGFSLVTLPHVDSKELVEIATQHKLAMAASSKQDGVAQSPVAQTNGSFSLSEQAAATTGTNEADSAVAKLDPAAQQEDQDEQQEALLRNLSPEIVIATWLSSLTISVLTHMTDVALPRIERLSKHGARQLASDLSYIANVARTLDVEPSDEFEAWRNACEAQDASAGPTAAGANGGGGSAEDKIWSRVSKIRSALPTSRK